MSQAEEIVCEKTCHLLLFIALGETHSSYPYFVAEKTRALLGEVPCPKPRSHNVSALGLGA